MDTARLPCETWVVSTSGPARDSSGRFLPSSSRALLRDALPLGAQAGAPPPNEAGPGQEGAPPPNEVGPAPPPPVESASFERKCKSNKKEKKEKKRQIMEAPDGAPLFKEPPPDGGGDAFGLIAAF